MPFNFLFTMWNDCTFPLTASSLAGYICTEMKDLGKSEHKLNSYEVAAQACPGPGSDKAGSLETDSLNLPFPENRAVSELQILWKVGNFRLRPTRKAWVKPFLAAFAKHGWVGRASESARISPRQVHRRRQRDPEFAQAYEATLANHSKERSTLGQKPATRLTVVCETCHKPFLMRRCHDRNRRHFCSRACYYATFQDFHRKPYRRNIVGCWKARREVKRHFSLRRGNEVHHHDGDNDNNSLSNLAVFASHAEHMSFHRGGPARPIWDGANVANSPPIQNQGGVL